MCDIIKYKGSLDIEIRNKAIKKAIRSKEFNASKMFEYAKKMKIYDKVKNYMEAIIWSITRDIKHRRKWRSEIWNTKFSAN